MNHPFAAPRITAENLTAAAAAVASPTSDMPASRSKTIGELGTLPVDLEGYIRELLLPSELQNAEALVNYGKSKTNFRVTIGAIIKAITKSDVGLDQVDNTPDADKPISTLMAEALAKKLDSDYKPKVSDVEGLEDLLSKFYNTEIGIQMSDVKDLVEVLAQKADKGHKHGIGDINDLSQALLEKAPANHSHNLTTLEGWADYIVELNNVLAGFMTKEQVQTEIDERALVLGQWDWA